MTAQEIIEKIRAEIERRKKINRRIATPEGDAAYYEDAALIAWMNSTFQEQPVCEGLEEEIEYYLDHAELKAKCNGISVAQDYFDDLINTARHFAQWQKMKDYDRYAHISLTDIHDAWHKLKETNVDIEKYPAVCFARDADWQKEQMMDEWLKDRDGCFWDGVEEGKKAMEKEAVEGYVDKDFIVTEGPSYFFRSVNLDLPNGFKEGDKVKLIIVKEEGK